MMNYAAHELAGEEPDYYRKSLDKMPELPQITATIFDFRVD
jgi:hypothetical protein